MTIRKRFQIVALLSLVAGVGAAADTGSLEREASWSPPTVDTVRQRVADWLEQSTELSEETRTTIDKIWQAAEPQSPDELYALVIESISLAEPQATEIIDFCASATSTVNLPAFEWLQSGSAHPFVSNHLRLYYGQWLGLRGLYEEVLTQLDGLQPDDVVDPAALLFFQAIAHHRLLDKENGLPLISKLMENGDAIPRRYSTMARLMEADIKPLKEDSLDEVSRLMDNIKTRLGHGRAGKRVRQEEDNVIAKLDKMIKQLEDQAQQQQQQQQSQQQGGAQQQATPMQDSMPGGISGPGNVKPKNQGDDTDWGNLPPKEREAALQQLGEDLPSHYRDVIEEYFQKLAKEQP